MGQRLFVTLPGGRTKLAKNRLGGPRAEKRRDKISDPWLRCRVERGSSLFVVQHTEPGVLGIDIPSDTRLGGASYDSNGHIHLRFIDGRKATLSLHGDEL